MFRGVLKRIFSQLLGSWGILYVAIVLAVLHLGHLSILDIAFVFFVGLFFAWVVQRTGSLVGVTLSHGLTNISLYLIVPFTFFAS